MEFPKNKLKVDPKSEKIKEMPRVDQTYINTRYQQIQESNDRLKKLMNKFSLNSQHKLTSVHESVICKVNSFKDDRDKSNIIKKKSPNAPNGFVKGGLDVIFETAPTKTKLDSANRKKVENENANKHQTKIKNQKNKNFININKKDAFDPHCLGGRNAPFLTKAESDKESN